MNMVMHMLSSDDWCNGMGLLSSGLGTGVLELATFLLESCFDSSGITMDMLTGFHAHNLVSVLFR
jgi:hypothetical protein